MKIESLRFDYRARALEFSVGPVAWVELLAHIHWTPAPTQVRSESFQNARSLSSSPAANFMAEKRR
jgi:hypothetical protein